MRTSILVPLVVAGLTTASAMAVPLAVGGKAWFEAGRVMHSSDTVQYDLNGSWLQSTGAQFTTTADLGEGWEGAFGFGAYQVNHSLASAQGLDNQPKFLAVTMYKSYITQAHLRYTRDDLALSGDHFGLTFGNFSHHYNGNARNFGMYLLRGPVYPGILQGGYGDFGTDASRANVLGARARYAHHGFTHDLLFMNEKDLPPTFDWSLAYIGTYRFLDAVEVGAGANLYRVLPSNPDLMRPGKLPGAEPSTYEVTSPGDTVFYTHQGVKLMGMFSVDLKRWLGASRMSAQDLRLYGEAAVLGVKDYGSYYDDIGERIPVMMGFNVPTFGLLDLLSVEVEWYGTPYKNDLANIGNPGSIVAEWTIQDRPLPSPAPIAHADSSRDDWKWSVTAEKTLRRHIQLTAQVANDHFRPRPIATGLITSGGGTSAAFTTSRDWYFTFRVGYFF